jgi:LEA14-like dessication related protein
MEFLLRREIDNKNSFAFDIDKFNYDFTVNNREWAQGQIMNTPKIKAAGKTAIPLTVSISAASMVRELVDIINRGAAVNYSCTGNMSLLSELPGLDIPDMPVELQGSTRIR